jgi:IS605 OrfB family transposase
MKLTAQIKLLPSAEQAESLRATMHAVNAAAAFAAQQGFAAKVYGQVSIHRLCYFAIRERFGLPANIAVRAISKAVEAFKRDKTICPEFRPDGAIPCSDRTYRIASPQVVSLAVLTGRIRIPYVTGDYFAGMLSRAKGEADLVFRDGQWFLYITVDFEEPPPLEPKDWIGVDLGIVNLATTSEGEVFSGEQTDRVRRRRSTARKQHQRKGSRRARRKLKRMSGRQTRFQHHVNHRIAKTLIGRAKALQAGIALEDLKGIRGRLEPTASRSFRRRFGNWSFAHLRQCITYKARLAGVPVALVDPRNTSRTCSQCGHCAKANRKTQAEFHCLSCGHQANADLNAAQNLRALGLGCPCNPPLKVAAPS